MTVYIMTVFFSVFGRQYTETKNTSNHFKYLRPCEGFLTLYFLYVTLLSCFVIERFAYIKNFTPLKSFSSILKDVVFDY